MILPHPKRTAHEMVRSVASGMAAEVYESLAANNDIYRLFPRQQMFVDYCWQQFLPQARDALVDMLDGQLSAKHKDDIVEALSLDYALLQADERKTINDKIH